MTNFGGGQLEIEGSIIVVSGRCSPLARRRRLGRRLPLCGNVSQRIQYITYQTAYQSARWFNQAAHMTSFEWHVLRPNDGAYSPVVGGLVVVCLSAVMYHSESHT